ncbi:glycoside hydrolase family 3 protein [bacterium]|nr:glycoside hydrolase family 3 protein [bacterium]
MSSLKEKLYQMFILGTQGGEYLTALENNLGGIIFFTYDIHSENQFKDLIQECKNHSKTPPFLSIDQEGGRVERTENIHHGKKYLSAKFAAKNGIDFVEKQTKEIAKELKNYGINLNFSPCIDVNTNPNNPIIGERSYSEDTDEVIKFGKLVAKTYRESGIIPCAKHFPGHGDADKDSHLTLPQIKLDFNELKKYHIKPFKNLIDEGIEMIMVAHLHIPQFEKEIIPTSLSKSAIQYLRKELSYEGIIISDDMVMKGVSDFGALKACEMGIRAGVNIFIYRDSTKETLSMIDELLKIVENDVELRDKIEDSYNRIILLKKQFGMI